MQTTPLTLRLMFIAASAHLQPHASPESFFPGERWARKVWTLAIQDARLRSGCHLRQQ
jgi:hypothetical protein